MEWSAQGSHPPVRLERGTGSPKSPRRALVKRPSLGLPDWRFDSARHPLIVQEARRAESPTGIKKDPEEGN
jgi:hypothetical protein